MAEEKKLEHEAALKVAETDVAATFKDKWWIAEAIEEKSFEMALSLMMDFHNDVDACKPGVPWEKGEEIGSAALYWVGI